MPTTDTQSDNPQSTTVDIPYDTAVVLARALGGTPPPGAQAGPSSVSVQLDADTGSKVKEALKNGLNSAVGVAWGEDEDGDH